jgi:NOL1/NOP2/sun family putative RNA methylase
MRLPETYVSKMKNLLKSEYEDYKQSLECERYYGLRSNDLKITSSEFNNISPFELENIPWATNGYYYSKNEQPAKHPFYHAGLYYIQEPSAMVPAAVLPIQEGDKVLDLCAAPGGKSTQIASKLHNTGLLVSNDISPSRTKGLLKNIEMFGITNAIVTSESPKKLDQYFRGFFDKVLVDAPCSGEGMFRKEPSIMKNWESCGVSHYVDMQKEILPYAANMLKAGGLMVYSTCTFAPEEDEQMIDWFLDEYKEFELVEISKEYGFESGNPSWSNGNEDLRKTARLWPHKIKGEGHFIALLRKKDGIINNSIYNNRSNVKEKDIINYLDFEKEVLNINLDIDRFEIINNKLYLLPEDMPNIKGLRVLRTGWYIGEFKKNRFEPSQAFASGLKIEDICKSVKLDVDDIDVIKYLKGETIRRDGNDGYNVLCVDKYPLGWVKKNRSMLKNCYQANWRMM